MNFKVGRKFDANVIFECNIDVLGDLSYLIIFGKHINGYYCCIPSEKIGCEMTDPDSVPQNRDQLIECGMDENIAQALAEAIKYLSVPPQ